MLVNDPYWYSVCRKVALTATESPSLGGHFIHYKCKFSTIQLSTKIKATKTRLKTDWRHNKLLLQLLCKGILQFFYFGKEHQLNDSCWRNWILKYFTFGWNGLSSWPPLLCFAVLSCSDVIVRKAQNTHQRGKYHFTADLLFDWFGFDQSNKCFNS